MALYDLLNTYGSEKVLAAIKSCLSSNLIGAEYVEATLSMNLSRVENRTCTKSAELSKPNPMDRSLVCYERFAIRLDGGGPK